MGEIVDISGKTRDPGVYLDNEEAYAAKVEADVRSGTRKYYEGMIAEDVQTIVSSIVPHSTNQLGLTGSESLATLRDFKSGSLVVAVAADSTANDLNDWVGLWLRLMAVDLPKEMRVATQVWNTTTEAYNSASVIQAGTSSATGGVAVSDSFNRVIPTIVGSLSENGVVWDGASSNWSANGTVATGTTGTIAKNINFKGGICKAVIDVVTAQTVATSWRLFVGALSAIGPGTAVWVSVSISATGQFTIQPYKTIAGTSTALSTAIVATTLGITNNIATPQQITVELAVDGTAVTLTATVGSTVTTRTAVLETSDVSALGMFAGVLATSGTTGLSLNYVELATPTVVKTSGVSVLNGAAAGTTLSYQQARLAALYPGKIDVLIVSCGHNYASQTPDEFTTAVNAFLTAYASLHPETLIVISSQNPQFSPSTTISAHADRQRALRLLAKQRGCDYVAAFEMFTEQPDGGRSQINTDGIHPTTPTTPNVTLGFGATSWAYAWYNVIKSRWSR